MFDFESGRRQSISGRKSHEQAQTKTDRRREGGEKTKTDRIYDRLHAWETEEGQAAATIDGMDVDEFIRQNADPIWLHQNGMWKILPRMRHEGGATK